MKSHILFTGLFVMLGTSLANDPEGQGRMSRHTVPLRPIYDGLILLNENIDTHSSIMSDDFAFPAVMASRNTEIVLDVPTDQNSEEQRFPYGGGYYGRPSLGSGYYGRPSGGGYYGGRPGGVFYGRPNQGFGRQYTPSFGGFSQYGSTSNAGGVSNGQGNGNSGGGTINYGSGSYGYGNGYGSGAFGIRPSKFSGYATGGGSVSEYGVRPNFNYGK